MNRAFIIAGTLGAILALFVGIALWRHHHPEHITQGIVTNEVDSMPMESITAGNIAYIPLFRGEGDSRDHPREVMAAILEFQKKNPDATIISSPTFDHYGFYITWKCKSDEKKLW